MIDNPIPKAVRGLTFVITVVLSPLLFVQGMATRKSVPELPEPPGPRRGEAGDGPPLRLLILGDSAAAGVGATHQDHGLLGQVIAPLSSNFRVQWVLEAKNGKTTAAMLNSLETMPPQQFDIAVTSLGVNDVTSMVGAGKWRRQQAELRRLLRQKFGVRTLIVSGLPPMHGFPALPQPLRWCLGARATQFNHDLESDVAAEDGAFFLDLRFTTDIAFMATDGFHPGPQMYAEWGKRVAAVVSSH